MRRGRHAEYRAINSAAGATEDAATIRRAVLACAAGQAFEIFDFVIYGFFAVAIGRAFFPSTDPAASLLASFATFAVGFLFRPVGAIVIGYYGDRFGRRKALVVTVGMMACATGHHRAHSVLCRDRALGTDPAGDVPHVPGFLHRRRVGRRRGVSGRACTGRTPWPDRQFPAGGDGDRRDGRDVLGGDPELVTECRQLLRLGLARAIPDRLRAGPDRLLPAHARRRDAGIPARGRDADHHAHADHGGDPHAWRHVRRGVRPVDHRLRDQLRVPGVPAELRIADAEDRSQPRAVVHGACRNAVSRADTGCRALLRSDRAQADAVRLLGARR